MVVSFCRNNTVNFINTKGVELFHIGKDKTGSNTYEPVYSKHSNTVAVSPGGRRGYRCIKIIDIESKKVMTTIPMDTTIYGMAVRGRTIYYCAWDKGLRMLDLNDQSVRDIINSDMSYVD